MNFGHLILMRGISGSGKSTVAEELRKQNPSNTIIVSRDALRLAFYNTAFGDPINEQLITYIEHGIIREALSRDQTVISDNTNLDPNIVRPLVAIAYEEQASVEIHEVETEITEAKRRNHARYLSGGRFVPENVIDSQSDKFYRHREHIKLFSTPLV